MLIGENGSGKSSLLSILSGLYLPTEGEVMIQNGQVADQETLRQQTAYVSPFFPQLQLSLRDNFFCETATDDEFVQALEKVGLWHLVENSEKGLDSIVGRELFFPKGQWQRFTIARLLVHKECSIWILDEPTSAMDALHEDKILRLVCQEGKDKILVIVSHRLTHAPKMNSIIHLENGRILFEGQHDKLMEVDPEYRDIFNAQKELYRVT